MMFGMPQFSLRTIFKLIAAAAVVTATYRLGGALVSAATAILLLNVVAFRYSKGESEPNAASNGNKYLLGALIVYGLVNIVAAAMVATGVVHPPWTILVFSTFIGPGLGIAGVGVAHALGGGSLFTRPAMAAFILTMLFAAYANFQLLGAVIAAV
jgi:hypothetical protein